jgi:Spy/CpxP family protein refolding chaperone
MKHLIALALLLSAPVQAQMPRGLFPWWEGRFVRDADLTGDQRRQIREILREHRATLIDQRAAVQKAEAEVEDLFNEEQVDQKRALEAIDRLIAARSEMTRTYARMSLKLRAVLTPEQWRELQRRRGDPARPRPQRKR